MAAPKNHRRFVITATVVNLAALAGSAVLLYLSASQRASIQHEAHQASTITLRPAPSKAESLKGYNVFIDSAPAERDSLVLLVGTRGGQVQQRLTIDTDIVLTGVNVAADQDAGIRLQARDLRIPVMNEYRVAGFSPGAMQ